MTKISSTTHAAGHFLVSEGNKTRSREQIVVLSGQVLKAGAVIMRNPAGKYVAFDAGETDLGEGDGSIGILYDSVDATTGDKDAVGVLRDAEVNREELNFGDDQDTGDEITAVEALKLVGIMCR